MTPEEVHQLLEGICSRVLLAEESPDCMLAYCQRREGPDLLVALAQAPTGHIYAKTAPEPLIPAHLWHCNNVFMTPYGLYSFAETPNELIEKIKAKQKLLKAQYRLAKQRGHTQ